MIDINEDECRDQLLELEEATGQAIDELDSTGCIGQEASERLEIAALDLLLDWAKAAANTRQYGAGE